jgi:hypothetical protein
MLDDKSLLELCLKVSGGFESGKGPSYTSLTGNFDGMGMSAGILQWNAGQGTLQPLVKMIGNAMGWDKAKTFFSSDIQAFSQLPAGAPAIQWCLDHYIATGSKNLDPGAAQRWNIFLGQPESIAAQVQIASNGVLAHAKREVAAYMPDFADGTRSYAFFFDLVTQEGGMTVGKQTVEPVTDTTGVDVTDALAFAQANNPACHDIWAASVANDDEAEILLHYAYARAMLANPQFAWDACSRRGTIACRMGIVHEARIDFTSILD